MKCRSLFIAFFLLSIISFGQTPAQPSPIQIGAYLPGISNLRDFANPNLSGFGIIDYNIYLNAEKFIDKFGNEVTSIDVPELGSIPLNMNVHSYINALALGYVSDEVKWLGNARYIGAISPNYMTADFRVGLGEIGGPSQKISGGSDGFGDLLVLPLFLTWETRNERFDFSTAYMFTAPTGRYETGAEDNIGMGYWNHAFQFITYYYMLNKATAFSVAQTFETHSKIKDVDVTPGNRYTIEYGISQYLSERFELMLQGGHTWQVGRDHGSDVYWDTFVKDRFSTVGAGIGFWPVKEKLYLNAKWFTNYAIRENAKFNAGQLQLIYVPWVKKPKTPAN